MAAVKTCNITIYLDLCIALCDFSGTVLFQHAENWLVHSDDFRHSRQVSEVIDIVFSRSCDLVLRRWLCGLGRLHRTPMSPDQTPIIEQIFLFDLSCSGISATLGDRIGTLTSQKVGVGDKFKRWLPSLASLPAMWSLALELRCRRHPGN
ncbi:hypothetical protein EVAR_67944_1 [Eumeta japonica]|uniref:Uncharacterized protein n=1 Tax=Eumeta variegata TaxID=151549 RepID=A0A4C2A4K1_EUMVA|nr:hypothetical protein EVAR_67944_1 [Eumeta japonica]